MNYKPNLTDPALTTIIVAVMVKKLGGSVEVTQEDMDAVAYGTLREQSKEDGSLYYTLQGMEQVS